MRVARGSTTWWAVASVCASACATSAPRQTGFMEAIPGVQMSASELRLRVRDLQDYIAATIEVASEDLAESTSHRRYQINAYLWRTNAIAAVQAVAFREDPLAALGDLIFLSSGMRHYFESDAAPELFGDSSAIALRAARRVDAATRALGESVVRDASWPVRLARLDSVAVAYPMVDLSFGQASVLTNAVALTERGPAGGLAAVASIDQVARDLSSRMNLYYKYLPKQFRWQMELFTLRLYETFGDSVRTDLHGVTTSINELTALVDAIVDTALIEGGGLVQDVAERERRAVLTEVDRQRIATLLALQGDLDAILADAQRQRVETLASVDSLLRATQESLVADSRGLVDHVFLRLAQLLLAMVVGAGVLVVLFNVTRRRHLA
jgi:hypothetical protein